MITIKAKDAYKVLQTIVGPYNQQFEYQKDLMPSTDPITSADELMMTLWENGRQVRLLGVGTAGLQKPVRQMNLWETPSDKERRLLTALDELRERFGRNAVQRGDSLDRKDRQ